MEPPTISSKVIVECDHGHITSRFIDDIVNAGTGCNTCATLNRIGFLHQRSPNDPLYYEPTTLYCLHFQSNVDTEEFWKVGVTSKRNARIPHDARNYTISVVETFHTTYNIAFHIEQQAKRILQHHYPICKFGGYTECYLDNPLNFIKGELARNIQ